MGKSRDWYGYRESLHALLNMRCPLQRWLRDNVVAYHPPGDYKALRAENLRRHTTDRPHLKA